MCPAPLPDEFKDRAVSRSGTLEVAGRRPCRGFRLTELIRRDWADSTVHITTSWRSGPSLGHVGWPLIEAWAGEVLSW